MGVMEVGSRLMQNVMGKDDSDGISGVDYWF